VTFANPPPSILSSQGPFRRSLAEWRPQGQRKANEHFVNRLSASGGRWGAEEGEGAFRQPSFRQWAAGAQKKPHNGNPPPTALGNLIEPRTREPELLVQGVDFYHLSILSHSIVSYHIINLSDPVLSYLPILSSYHPRILSSYPITYQLIILPYPTLSIPLVILSYRILPCPSHPILSSYPLLS